MPQEPVERKPAAVLIADVVAGASQVHGAGASVGVPFPGGRVMAESDRRYGSVTPTSAGTSRRGIGPMFFDPEEWEGEIARAVADEY